VTSVWLRATMHWCLRLLVLLLLTGAGRLAYVAYQHRPPKVVHTPLNTVTSTAVPDRANLPFGLDALQHGLAPAVPSDLLREINATGVAGGPARLTRLRIYLVVNVGPDRSEVLVNGVTHGQTPYVGEVNCQPGGMLSITVVPGKGMPKHFDRACDRNEIRIQE